MENKNLTEDQLLEIYDLVFSQTHSPGFKKSEIRSLLFDCEYSFLERPKENWYKNLMEYLEEIGYNCDKLEMNPAIIVK